MHQSEHQKDMNNNSEKQLAIHLQKIQFQQMEIIEIRERNQQLKKNYQEALSNVQDNSKGNQENYQIKIFEEKREFQRNIERREAEFEQRVRDFELQIRSACEQQEQTSFQLVLEKKNFEVKENDWKQTNKRLQEICQNMEQKLISTERDHQDQLKEKDNYFRSRVKQLDQENDDMKKRLAQELRDNQAKGQQAISVVKKYAEIDRINSENRLQNEKQYSQKRLSELTAELETKMSEEKQALEEENSELQERAMEMERNLVQKLQSLKYDSDINLQKTVNKFMDEKVELTKQNALLDQELTLTKRNLEKQLQQLRFSSERQIQNSQKSAILEYEQAIARIKDDKETLQAKYDSLKKCNRVTEQDNLKLKSQSQKQKAIFKQRQASYQKKVVQLQNSLKLQLESYNITIEKINDANVRERAQLNNEIQKMKDHIVILNEEIALVLKNAQNDKGIMQATINYHEAHLKRNKVDYEDILHKFDTTVKHLSKQREVYKADTGNHDTILKMKEEYEKALEEERNRNFRILKDYDEKLSKAQSQIKSLKDKLLMNEIRPSYQQKMNHSQDLQKVEKRFKEKQQKYYQKIRKLEEALQQARISQQTQMMQFEDLQMVISQTQKDNFQDRSDRTSISNYSANTNSRYHMQSDGKSSNGPLGRKSFNAPLINTTQKGGRIIEKEDDYTGIKRYHKY